MSIVIALDEHAGGPTPFVCRYVEAAAAELRSLGHEVGLVPHRTWVPAHAVYVLAGMNRGAEYTIGADASIVTCDGRSRRSGQLAAFVGAEVILSFPDRPVFVPSPAGDAFFHEIEGSFLTPAIRFEPLTVHDGVPVTDACERLGRALAAGIHAFLSEPS